MRITAMALACAAMATATAVPLSAAPPRDKSDAEKSADDQDKMICKRFADTGSLVSTNKLCKTKREWDIYRAELRQNFKTGSCAGSADGSICN